MTSRSPRDYAQMLLRLIRSKRFWNALFWIVIALGTLRALRSTEGREWLWNTTGETSLFEGVKGVAALAWLQVAGPKLDLQPDVRVEHVSVVPYGVNTFLELESDVANVRHAFEMMRDGHIAWARQEFPWEDIEIHGRGDFQDRRHQPARSAWDKYDRIVNLAKDYGVNLLVRLDNPPDWAYADPKAAGEKGPPDNLDDFGKFVSAVVKRYCGQVTTYQIWNEPNIFPEWGNRDVDPAAYAKLIKLAADRARGVCPGVVIVSAALAPTTEPGGKNMDDLKYLAALYKAGWQSDFDIMAANAYGLWTGPTDQRASPDRANFVRPELVRSLMVQNGDAAKPVWFTEMGWDSPPESMPAPYGRVTEEDRARYTVLGYQRMAAEWPWAGVGFLWFLRRPDMEWHKRPEGYFRLLEPDWTPTLTYQSMVELAGQQATLQRGRHRADHPALRYAGPWRNAPLDGPLQQKVGSKDAEMQFTFAGTGFQLSLAPTPTRTLGSASPSSPLGSTSPLNPAAAAQTAVTAGLASAPKLFLILDGDQQEVVLKPDGNRWIYAQSGLDAGEHIAIVRVDSGEMWLDEVKVDVPDRPWPFRPVVQWVLIVAGLVALKIAVERTVAWLWRRWGPQLAKWV